MSNTACAQVHILHGSYRAAAASMSLTASEVAYAALETRQAAAACRKAGTQLITLSSVSRLGNAHQLCINEADCVHLKLFATRRRQLHQWLASSCSVPAA